MRRGCVLLLLLSLLASCTQTIPYLVTTGGCNCQEYVFRDRKNNLEIAFNAYYKVGERVTLEINGLMLGTEVLDPVIIHMIPVNPKLSS